MKELIGAVASVILILALIFQFTRFQTMGLTLLEGEIQVSSFAKSASEAGCVEAEDLTVLKEKMSRILGCGTDEIQISGPDKPVEPGKNFTVRVTGPVTGVIGDPGFWKISSDENRFLFSAERQCISGKNDKKVDTGKEP